MKFEDVEDMIIDTLKASLPYLKRTATYAGEFETDVKALPSGFPAAFVVYRGSRFEPVDNSSCEEQAEFTVLVAAKDLKGGEQPRKGEYGAYRLLEDVLSALANRDLGLKMERLEPVRVSLVFVSQGIAVYGMDFRAKFDRTY
jgi:phage gp37-like protein